MRTVVDEAVSEFIEQIGAEYPRIIVEILDAPPPHGDTCLRVWRESDEDTFDVSEAVARLTREFYIKRGLSLRASTMARTGGVLSAAA